MPLFAFYFRSMCWLLASHACLLMVLREVGWVAGWAAGNCFQLNICCRTFYVECRLQVHPVSGIITKIQSQPDRGIGRNAAFAQDDFVNAPWRYPDITRQPVLAELVWLKVLVKQDFSGVQARHG